MSSFPKHENNIKDLEELGFDVEEYKEDGCYESWNYDSLNYLLAEVIWELKSNGVSLKSEEV